MAQLKGQILISCTEEKGCKVFPIGPGLRFALTYFTSLGEEMSVVVWLNANMLASLQPIRANLLSAHIPPD